MSTYHVITVLVSKVFGSHKYVYCFLLRGKPQHSAIGEAVDCCAPSKLFLAFVPLLHACGHCSRDEAKALPQRTFIRTWAKPSIA